MSLIKTEPEAKVPATENGDPFAYAMTLPDSTLYADSVTELIGALIEGYDKIENTGSDSDQTLIARWEFSTEIANNIQQLLAASATEAGDFNPANVSEDELNLILGNRRHPVEVTTWEGTVPLVLLTMHYAPFTTRTIPSGNIRWIDPSDEASLLRSLTALGLLEFHVQQGA